MAEYKMPDGFQNIRVCCFNPMTARQENEGYSIVLLRDLLAENRFSIVNYHPMNRIAFDIAPCDVEARNRIEECKVERLRFSKEHGIPYFPIYRRIG